MATDAASISSLSLRSLRVELQRRNLPTSGLKSALISRLTLALSRTRSTALSVPPVFPTRRGIVEAAKKRLVATANDERRAKRARLDVVGVVMHGGAAVWVCGEEEMEAVWGVVDGYGKGSLSRSEPLWRELRAGVDGVTAKGGRAARQLAVIEKGGGSGEAGEDEEHLTLPPVDAFYAVFEERPARLRLVDSGGRRMDSVVDVWKLFCEGDVLFARKYACYVKYRRAGWIPRSGLKYGVDLVLYEGKAKRHAHSPYCVVLQFEETGLAQNFVRLQTRLRLVKNVAKRLIIARVTLDVPGTAAPATPAVAVENVSVQELTVDRWVT